MNSPPPSRLPPSDIPRLLHRHSDGPVPLARYVTQQAASPRHPTRLVSGGAMEPTKSSVMGHGLVGCVAGVAGPLVSRCLDSLGHIYPMATPGGHWSTAALIARGHPSLALSHTHHMMRCCRGAISSMTCTATLKGVYILTIHPTSRGYTCYIGNVVMSPIK
jgi:hypothetical protein